MVFVSSFTKSCSRRTWSLKRAFSLPSTIFSITCSGLPDSLACTSKMWRSRSSSSAGNSSRTRNRGEAGLAMCSAMSFTSCRNSSVLATKSVSQLTSTRTPTVLLKWM